MANYLLRQRAVGNGPEHRGPVSSYHTMIRADVESYDLPAVMENNRHEKVGR